MFDDPALWQAKPPAPQARAHEARTGRGTRNLENGPHSANGAATRAVPAPSDPLVTGHLSGYLLVQVFGAIRAEYVQGALEWVGPRDANGKAADMADAIDSLEDQAAARQDLRPTMHALFADAVAGKLANAADVLASPSLAFACWCSRFTALRERLHGVRPVPRPPDDAAADDLPEL